MGFDVLSPSHEDSTFDAVGTPDDWAPKNPSDFWGRTASVG
jgi:hypothetical protein